MVQLDKTKPAPKPAKRPSRKVSAAVNPVKPPMTKRDRLRERLEQADGVSLAQLAKEFGWQPHTVRAAISGLRKRGLDVQRGAGDASSVYRIVASKAA